MGLKATFIDNLYYEEFSTIFPSPYSNLFVYR